MQRPHKRWVFTLCCATKLRLFVENFTETKFKLGNSKFRPKLRVKQSNFHNPRLMKFSNAKPTSTISSYQELVPQE